MTRKCLASIALLAVALSLLLLARIPVVGQTPSRPGNTWTRRVPWGEPDLQGVWSNATITPLERPAALGGKEFLTDDDIARLEQQARTPVDTPPRPGDPGSYNAFWLERGTKVVGTRRTSLIVDPPEGKIPALTAEGQKRADAAAVRGTDSYDSRSLYERCITRGLPPAMLPGFYNHNYEIVQAPGYLVVLVEMIHDARIIPLDGRPHVNRNIHQWLGDSRGHWDGNTLVVDTTNFSQKSSQYTGGTGDASTSYQGASDSLHLVERFTRIDADTIDYRFTVDDPSTFTRPWTVATPMTRIEGPLYEYACHEGNYAMTNMLSAARAKEKVDSAATNK